MYTYQCCLIVPVYHYWTVLPNIHYRAVDFEVEVRPEDLLLHIGPVRNFLQTSGFDIAQVVQNSLLPFEVVPCIPGPEPEPEPGPDNTDLL